SAKRKPPRQTAGIVKRRKTTQIGSSQTNKSGVLDNLIRSTNLDNFSYGSYQNRVELDPTGVNFDRKDSALQFFVNNAPEERRLEYQATADRLKEVMRFLRRGNPPRLDVTTKRWK